jgi:aminopeptidase N
MKSVFHLALVLLSLSLHAQSKVFTKDDTLRGSLTPQRTWWDLTYYHLNVNVKPSEKFISGNVAIYYKVIDSKQEMQIDLQPPLVIEKITQDGEALDFAKKGANAYFVTLKKNQKRGSAESVTVQYSGIPVEAKRPPWQGGFQWTTDKDGNPFAATSCQGLGASVWWPCKDHMYDEPDSMLISVTVPKQLIDVSNGRLRSAAENADGTKTFNWFVRNPINNYGVNVNIANYTHFADTLHGLKGTLDLNYYVLPENLEKAKEQFKQAKLMLRAFEYWFGPYPFYEDGYKLVEVPYLGMEHQSSVTYGNKYQNGYLGRDLSKTGWGLKWDFIIIHESGHEWFANNITYKDMADMWIHESFTNYSESLFIEYYYGKEAATEYVVGTRGGIRNDRPIIGVYNVNQGGSGDMYPKGGNMLHTIRHSINNDKLFREILLGLNKTFYHQTVTAQQIEGYISDKAKINFAKVFDQYLRTTQIPAFEYYLDNNRLFYHWTNCVKGFNLSLILADGKTRIKPTEKWQSIKLKDIKQFDPANVEKMYYVKIVSSPKTP